MKRDGVIKPSPSMGDGWERVNVAATQAVRNTAPHSTISCPIIHR